ncbi:MAG: rhomboid family intramembrane serine protease [Verrucomicrobiales bacterium]|nr:rhomboid family intramembrane serine protease [Verrucomicrobiales bacterium]
MEPEIPVPAPRRRSLVAAFFDNTFLLLGLTFLAWGIELVDWVLGHYLDNSFGIRPRDVTGLSGILTAHWLHGGPKHLISNTLPFLMLGGFVLLGGKKLFWKVTLFVALIGGGLLWLLGGSGENHIGASLVIFGYLGFLLARGFFERSGLWITVSVVTLLLYGGMIFGILPGQEGVSWMGHLFGFFCGIAAAKALVPKNIPIYRVEGRNVTFTEHV